MDGSIPADTDPVFTRRKLTIREYELMGEVGILHHEDRVELIDGEIIDMAPIGQGHVATTNDLTRILVTACGDRAIVSVANPVIIGRHSAPQPDFAIFRPRWDNYHYAHRPGPEETLLLVEVSEGSLAYDSGVKLDLYARSGVPEYWIVDLAARLVAVHRRPGPGGYGERTTHQAGETLALAAEPAIAVVLDRIFGAPLPG